MYLGTGTVLYTAMQMTVADYRENRDLSTTFGQSLNWNDRRFVIIVMMTMIIIMIIIIIIMIIMIIIMIIRRNK